MGVAELAYRSSLKSASTAPTVAVILQLLKTHVLQLFKSYGLCLRDQSIGGTFQITFVGQFRSLLGQSLIVGVEAVRFYFPPALGNGAWLGSLAWVALPFYHPPPPDLAPFPACYLHPSTPPPPFSSDGEVGLRTRFRDLPADSRGWGEKNRLARNHPEGMAFPRVAARAQVEVRENLSLALAG